MPVPSPLARRTLLASLATSALGGCAAPLPPVTGAGTSGVAAALLQASAAAHGLAAFRDIRDLNVGYAGTWPPLIDRLQPVLVDRGFRERSEERLLPRVGLVAQAHAGPAGHKQVLRRSEPGTPGEVQVWFNGEEARDETRRAAAALVADGYALFLLGPMLLAGGWGTSRAVVTDLGGEEEIRVGGRSWRCDRLRARVAPGIGLSAGEQLALFIDRDARLLRRLRFSLEGLASTRGAVAEVDLFDHVRLHGVWWPTGFHERLLRPFPLPVHDWRLTGLDVNRGLVAAELDNPRLQGRALAPAGAVSGTGTG